MELPGQSLHASVRFRKKESEVTQSCPTLCNPMDCSLSGSSVHGIFKARVLEGVVISFSRGSSWLRDRTRISHIAGRCFTFWGTREACSFQRWDKLSTTGWLIHPSTDKTQQCLSLTPSRKVLSNKTCHRSHSPTKQNHKHLHSEPFPSFLEVCLVEEAAGRYLCKSRMNSPLTDSDFYSYF